MKRALRLLLVSLGVFAGLGLLGFLLLQNQAVRDQLVLWLTPEFEAPADASQLAPRFTEKDADRSRIAVKLEVVVAGVTKPVDLTAHPGGPMVVLEQDGAAKCIVGGAAKPWFQLPVATGSEKGLLGIAFDPQFAQTRRFFVHYSKIIDGQHKGRLAVMKDGPTPCSAATGERPLLEVDQPYSNHNGGQIAFGPDGMLYMALGDGGYADDPHGHGQNKATLLGSILRLDVRGGALKVPPDNPFAGGGGRPEIEAYGLRNPWRFSFAGARGVAGDVGQNLWEELTVIEKGENHGWKTREARHCFPPGERCSQAGLVDPVYEYGRDEGISVTGGYVYRGAKIPGLKGKYVFGDFASGRIWAIDLPADRSPVKKAWALGRWPVVVSAFGVDAAGELYLADYSSSRVLRMVAP